MRCFSCLGLTFLSTAMDSFITTFTIRPVSASSLRVRNRGDDVCIWTEALTSFFEEFVRSQLSLKNQFSGISQKLFQNL